MDSRQWREALRVDLRRQNLPPAYIDRLVEELSDHLLDTQTENPSMDAHNALACLGSTDTIAAVASHEFRSRTFASRHPWLIFVVFPIVFVPLLFGLIPLLVFSISWLYGTTLEWFEISEASLVPSTSMQPRLEWWILAVFDSCSRFVPFIFGAWLFCRWGRRSGMRWWPLVACTIVATTSGFLFTKSIPSTADQPGLLVIGLATRFEAHQFVQLLVPLAVAGWMLIRLPKGLLRPNATAV